MKLSILLTLLPPAAVTAFHTAPIKSRTGLQQVGTLKRTSYLNYSPNDDPLMPNNGGVWTALQLTEKWISAVLGDPGIKNENREPHSNNPYARKEVSYSCEMTDQTVMAIAGIFR
jgi:hypothetical protein